MQLPVQRTTARQQLRKAIVNFFGYFDADESGELSGAERAELRQVFARMINLEAGSSGSQQGLEFNTVLDALMRRYDENGDGEVTFGKIARRLLCVMEAPEAPPLPDPTPDPGAKGKRAEGGARAKADSQLLLERRVDRHESAWAARLAATSPTDLPRQLLRRVAKRLEQFDLDGNGHLETVELRRIMSDYMPALSEAEMECLVARYDPEGRGIVVAQAAARRICGLVTGPNRGSNRGGTKQQQQQQQQAPSEAQLRALTDRKLEDHLIGTLRSRMKTDTPAEARRVVKVLVSRFDDDADMDVPYASMLTCLKLLLHVDDRDAQKTAELKHLIRSLDRDRSGTVSQEELAARVFAGLRRAVGVANPSASSAASSAAAPWLVVEAEAARHSTEASLGELGGDAIFDAPDQKSALETRKRVRALASALQELVGARLRGGWSAPRALKATQQVFQPFASKLHPGTLVAANEDGTVDIAVAPQTGAGGGAGLVVRGVAACAVAPKDHQANWVPKPQAEAADSGQGGGGRGGAAAYYKLKVGNLVEFRSGALLGRWDEFPTALRALFPRALESDLGLLAAKLARPQTRHAPGAGPAQSPVVALGDLARWLCKSARDEEARAARRR